MEIIAGKWYKNSQWTSSNDLCKATGVVGSNVIHFNEKITNGKFKKEDNFWCYLSTCVEAEYEEYGKYLPDGHPDKRKTRKIEDMPVELVNFPSEGYCETTDKRLVKYLISRPESMGGNPLKSDAKGIAWNPTSYWYVVGVSLKSVYTLEHLEKFFTEKPKPINEWGLNTYLVIVKEGYLDYGYKLTNKPKTKIGHVGRIDFFRNDESVTGVSGIEWVFEKDLAKWFATKEEAEAFAKTLNKDSMNNEFKKGDYIVTLNVGVTTTSCGKNGFCFKQREDANYIEPVCDLKNSDTNSHWGLTFDKSNHLKDWRYATKDEIQIYNELKKPFDVTALPNVGNYITVTHNDNEDEKIICKYNRKWDALRCYGPIISNFDSIGKFTFNNDLGVCFIGDDRKYRPSTDEEIAWLDACVKNGGIVGGIVDIIELIDFKTCAGRIVKAKKDRPYSIPIKIGEYGTLDDEYGIKLSNYSGTFGFVEDTFYEDFEVMPKGFTLPEPKEEIEKEPEYKVVECKSQAEWDFVSKKLGYTWNEPRFDYCNDNCINIQRKSRSNLAFYKKENSLIYSFDEWCKKFNHTFDKFDGIEYVELDIDFCGYKEGDIAKVINTDGSVFEIFAPNRKSQSSFTPNVFASRTYLNPSTKEAYDKQHATVTLDTSGSMVGLYKETPKTVDFKVGDWVVFEVDKCFGDLSYCKTVAWDRDMVLQIEGFETRGGNPKFTAKQMQNRYPHHNWGSFDGVNSYDIGNTVSLFRHAYSWEIPSETTKDTTYELKPISTVKTYQLFIEKTQAKPVVADKPINLIKTRKLQINLVD